MARKQYASLLLYLIFRLLTIRNRCKIANSDAIILWWTKHINLSCTTFIFCQTQQLQWDLSEITTCRKTSFVITMYSIPFPLFLFNRILEKRYETYTYHYSGVIIFSIAFESLWNAFIVRASFISLLILRKCMIIIQFLN